MIIRVRPGFAQRASQARGANTSLGLGYWEAAVILMSVRRGKPCSPAIETSPGPGTGEIFHQRPVRGDAGNLAEAGNRNGWISNSTLSGSERPRKCPPRTDRHQPFQCSEGDRLFISEDDHGKLYYCSGQAAGPTTSSSSRRNCDAPRTINLGGVLLRRKPTARILFRPAAYATSKTLDTWRTNRFAYEQQFPNYILSAAPTRRDGHDSIEETCIIQDCSQGGEEQRRFGALDPAITGMCSCVAHQLIGSSRKKIATIGSSIYPKGRSVGFVASRTTGLQGRSTALKWKKGNTH